MTKSEELDQQIAELKIEIEKIKKTKIEETVIERRQIPTYHIYPRCG